MNYSPVFKGWPQNPFETFASHLAQTWRALGNIDYRTTWPRGGSLFVYQGSRDGDIKISGYRDQDFLLVDWCSLAGYIRISGSRSGFPVPVLGHSGHLAKYQCFWKDISRFCSALIMGTWEESKRYQVVIYVSNFVTNKQNVAFFRFSRAYY